MLFKDFCAYPLYKAKINNTISKSLAIININYGASRSRTMAWPGFILARPAGELLVQS